MKKAIYEFVAELIFWAIIIGMLSAFVKGVNTMMDFMKNCVASILVVVPTGLLLEYYDIEPFLKYTIVSVTGSFGICLFNGLGKIFKKFEENPEEFIKRVRKNVGRTDDTKRD